MPITKRWEHGSEFHWPSVLPTAVVANSWPEAACFWASGRDAFRALLLHGQRTRDWRRLWIPAYFCQEVAEAMQVTGITLTAYPDGPQFAEPVTDNLDFQPGDVVLRVNFFGLRVLPSVATLRTQQVETIDDHTHDPWSTSALQSDADWCLASLRKTLPVPDGGMLWSPVGHALPASAQLTAERRLASLEKLAAMLLKDLYLRGQPVEKQTFRQLALSGEAHIAAGEISDMPDWTRSLLAMFPVDDWRAIRRRNFEITAQALTDLPWLKVLQPAVVQACPFSAVLLVDSKPRRSFMRQKLIEAQVYPAVLWPLDVPIVVGVGEEFQDFSARMLSLHCDMRYSEADMLRVAELIKQFGAQYAD
jgi:hypothetical protein